MNEQKAEKISIALENVALSVQAVFKTIQGEGPYVGTPAIFIRFAGCNLQCPKCDTDYTSNRFWITASRLVEQVCEMTGDAMQQLVVITGGEPFRQPLRELTDRLLGKGFTVQIETNGTIFQPLDFARIIVVCSPKTGSVSHKLRPHVAALKYVLSADDWDRNDGLPLTALGNPIAQKLAKPWPEFAGIIYLQPIDEQDSDSNNRHLVQCVENCLQFGYRLCLQTHKLCNLP